MVSPVTDFTDQGQLMAIRTVVEPIFDGLLARAERNRDTAGTPVATARAEALLTRLRQARERFWLRMVDLYDTREDWREDAVFGFENDVNWVAILAQELAGVGEVDIEPIRRRLAQEAEHDA